MGITATSTAGDGGDGGEHGDGGAGGSAETNLREVSSVEGQEPTEPKGKGFWATIVSIVTAGIAVAHWFAEHQGWVDWIAKYGKD